MELIKRFYKAFNAHDVDRVVEHLHADVAWDNALEGAHVHGRDDVRTYLERQWAAIDPHVDPLSIDAKPDGTVTVRVHQTVRDMHGTVVKERPLRHVFGVVDDRIKSFDILPPEDASAA